MTFADRTITEITCHDRGASFLSGETLNIIDIRGQDTKFILMKNGIVNDFLMNDKCATGTGGFVEVMANRLGLILQEMFDVEHYFIEKEMTKDGLPCIGLEVDYGDDASGQLLTRLEAFLEMIA